MYFLKVLQQFYLELVAIALLGLAYVVFRYVIIRRKITYKEFEVYCFILFGVAVVVFVLFYR